MCSPLTLRRLALLLVALLLATSIGSVAAAPRCFAETGQCIDGRVRAYWEQNGGLPVFGLPLTPEEAGQYRTQIFERNSFELHPENAAPYDVLLGRLGDVRLQQLGRDWQTFPKAAPDAPHFFPQTGHAIAHAPFWQYWSSHGLELGDRGVSERESLALFGLPLSEPAIETNGSGDTVLTQWFERARFEDHGAKGVLLGLLGAEVRANAAPPAPLPPSFNNCQADPNAAVAPNYPVRIVGLDKGAETVTLRNVSPTAVELAGWRICSIRGNQSHATLSGTLNPGEERLIPSAAASNIWSNDEDDDATLYDASGSLVSYWDDRTPAGGTAPDPSTPPAPSPDPAPAPPAPPAAPPSARCDPAYPDFCIPPPPPDLDCGDIGRKNFTVRAPDPHRFDRDGDGIGCES